MRFAGLLVCVITLALSGAGAQQGEAQMFEAIRTDDLSALKNLIKEPGPNTPDALGFRPLTLAAAFGSLDAMRLLIDGGAEVNLASTSGFTPLHLAVRDPRKVALLLERGAAVNVAAQNGSTPLVIAASTNGASASVTLLLAKGADVNAADRTGITALLSAALVDDGDSAKLLLDAGADPSVRAEGGGIGTPLIAAAGNGNLTLTRLLLARRVDVGMVSTDYATAVKNGPVLFGHVTALHTAVGSRKFDVVKELIEAKADVNARDIRGMTPLMIAVATDHPDVRIVQLLRLHGADISIKSTANESAEDWARKFNHPGVMAELKLQRVSPAVITLRTGPVVTPRAAVERSMPLLQSASAKVWTDGGCVACHAQPITVMSTTLAKARGWTVQGADALASQAFTNFSSNLAGLFQPRFGGGAPVPQLYTGAMLSMQRAAPSHTTDALVYYLAATQRTAGNWQGVGARRAPIQDGDMSYTALGVRVLSTLATPALHDELSSRVQRAVAWLKSQTPVSTEDRVMQLLGVAWGDPGATVKEQQARDLIAEQRGDGGWGQTPDLPSDAYATGQVLYALSDSGATVPQRVFDRGVDFLLRTQKPDGSWHVMNRAMKIQPYFESSFPYGHDQWISQMASAWATMALSSVPDPR